jgi:hypothetical protein
MLTNQQGMTDSSLLPLVLLLGGSGRRGRFDKLALIAVLISQQQQQAQAAAAASGGVAPPPNNSLALLLALGLFGEEREREVVELKQG